MSDGVSDVPGLGLIRLAAALVPRRRRAAWRREWEAETAWAWKRMAQRGEPGAADRLRLRLRVLTCLIDAIMERGEGMTMTGILNDLRFAARGLLRSPSFTLVAVVTLALGIGANTAVFSLVDGVLFKPLPYPESDALVSVAHSGREGQDQLPVSLGLYLLYDERAGSLSDIALHQPVSVNLVGDGDPERIDGFSVTPGFFETLGVQPAAGRTFAAEEGRPGGEQVVILSDGLWRRRFGADPTILGTQIDLSGTMRTVVAIMPADFSHPGARSGTLGTAGGTASAQLWIPIVIDPTTAPLANFSASGIGRLAPGFDAEGVRAELQDFIARLGELRPEAGPQAAFLSEVGLQAHVEPLKEAIVGDLGTTLWILLGTVGFVLLIACANVANLFLVRAEGRHRELALRVAVGAGKLQVLRPFLAESAVLATLGGALGVGAAALAVRVTTALAPTDIPRLDEVGIDPRVLLFTLAISILSAVLFGLFPMVRYGREDLAAQLKEGAERGGTGGRSRHRVRNGLVVAQVALALVLLVGSGLMLRSFAALRAVDPGFEPENLLVVRVTIPTAEVADNVEAALFFRQLQDRLSEQPGVVSVGSALGVPMSGILGLGSVDVEDHPRGEAEMPVFASLQRVESGFFETMEIPLVEGRYIEPGDGADGYRAVVVSESFARHWWPNQSALGRRMRQGPFEDWYEIVGVVRDVHYSELTNEPEEMMYGPALWGQQVGAEPQPTPGGGPPQGPQGPIATRAMDVVVRTQGDPLAMLEVVRREVRALNPRIPLANPRTMQSVIADSTARTSFTMVVLAAAAGVALLLGMIGIYGVVSYVVSQRTREIGVRMALGASAPTVRSMVVRQGMTVAVAGVVVGLLAAFGMSSVIASLLYGVSAMDPLTYSGVAVALAGVAAFASWLPAQRATRVDPSTALRTD